MPWTWTSPSYHHTPCCKNTTQSLVSTSHQQASSAPPLAAHTLRARSHRDAEQQAQHPQPAKDDGEDHADDDAIGGCCAGGVALLGHVRRAVVARERVYGMQHVTCNRHCLLRSVVQQSLINWHTSPEARWSDSLSCFWPVCWCPTGHVKFLAGAAKVEKGFWERPEATLQAAPLCPSCHKPLMPCGSSRAHGWMSCKPLVLCAPRPCRGSAGVPTHKRAAAVPG